MRNQLPLWFSNFIVEGKRSSKIVIRNLFIAFIMLANAIGFSHALPDMAKAGQHAWLPTISISGVAKKYNPNLYLKVDYHFDDQCKNYDSRIMGMLHFPQESSSVESQRKESHLTVKRKTTSTTETMMPYESITMFDLFVRLKTLSIPIGIDDNFKEYTKQINTISRLSQNRQN